MFYAPVPSVERVSFRTGDQRLYPTPETPADWDGVLPNAGEQEPLSVYKIANFTTSSSDNDTNAAVLRYADFSHYTDRFNTMEDENIAQAIPNSESSKWMEENIPLFDCPQKNSDEIYYFLWWSLRKHI